MYNIKVSSKGKRIWVEMFGDCRDILFRVGFENLMNKLAVERGMTLKLVTLPADELKAKGKTAVMSDEEVELCVQEGILESIRALLRKYEQEAEMSKSKASPKSTKVKNGSTKTKRSSGCVGSAIARARARRRG